MSHRSDPPETDTPRADHSACPPDVWARTRLFFDRPAAELPRGTLPLSDAGEQPATPPAESFVPGYSLVRELGRGANGIVYRARHLRLKREVALKVMFAPPHAASRSADRFRREAESVARLRHPNIVQIYESGEAGGVFWSALELAEGGSLDRRLRQSVLEPAEAARLATDLARAVQAAHAQGVLHRDLKPSNVLLTADGIPKVADFGLAKDLADDSGSSRTGDVLGTPSYMAPEQARGDSKHVGPAADVWALGAILYECLTGRPPFRGPTVADTLERVQRDDPVAIRRLAPGCPRDLETVCLKCLHKDPARRYASAGELADDLGRFLAGDAVLARPVSCPERAWRWSRRNPTIAALCGAAALLVLLATAADVLWLQALRAENRLLVAERAERERLDRKAAVFGTLLDDARKLLPSDPATAAQKAREALAHVEGEDGFTEGRAAGEALLADADRSAEALRERAAAREALEAGRRAAAVAFFHAALSARPGADPAAADDARTARTAFQRALADGGWLTDSERTEAAECVGELLLLEGEALLPDASAALECVRRADAAAGPTRSSAALRSRCLAAQGRKAEADAAAAEAARREPASVTDFYLAGVDRIRSGDPDAADELLAAALRRRPGHFGARYALAVCHLNRRRFDRARETLTACLADRPDFLWPLLLRGFALVELGEFTAAEEDLTRVLASASDARALYAARVHLGLLRLRQREPQAAEAILREAAADRPDDPQAFVLLAEACEACGEPGRADSELGRALGRRPHSAVLLHARAHLRLRRGDLAGARADFAAAARHAAREGDRGTLAVDLAELGRLLLKAGRPDEAVAAYRDALTADPRNAPILRLRAEALLALGRDAEADADLDAYEQQARGLEEFPRRLPEVLSARAALASRAGNDARAAEFLGRALALRSDAGDHVRRGWLYLRNDAHRLARPDFDAALRLAPGDADALAGRAECGVRAARDTRAVRAALADAEEAAKAAVDRGGEEAARLLYRAARSHALALPRWEAEGDSREVQRAQERAVDHLRHALEALPESERPAFWRQNVRRDPTLAPLRRSTSMAKLAAAYDAGQ